jgi:thiol-disulfide isomerase/thioredoxin
MPEATAAGAPSRLERLGPEAFDGGRLLRPGTVAVAFLADWCPFCRTFEPEFARLSAGAGGRLLVADMTAMDSPLWDRFAVEVVPTVVVFREGKVAFRADGVAGEGLGPTDLSAIARALRSSGRTAPRRRAPSRRVRSGGT